MRGLKTRADWKVAVIYFLVYALSSGVIGVVYSLFWIYVILNLINVPPVVGIVGSFVFPLVMVWGASRFAASFVKKRFVVHNARRIALIAAYYYLAVDILNLVKGLLIAQIDGVPLEHNYLLYIGTAVVNIVLFFVLSKKYLSETKI